MGLKIASRLFSGPYSMQTFKRRANQSQVLFAVVSKSGPSWDPDHHLIDIGTHDDEGVNFAAVAEVADWESINGGTLLLFVDFFDNRRTTRTERDAFVEEIRSAYKIPGAYIRIA